MLTILNDVHIGAERTAGTTKDTRLALRNRLIDKFKQLLPATGDLMILGDLFDKFNAPARDVAMLYEVLGTWLSHEDTGRLYLVAGNHDISKSSEVYSSFDLLCSLLSSISEYVIVVKEPQLTQWGYVIPHLSNQDLFNGALAAVPECDYLFLHCNYDNFFASQSDQSLNISREQAAECKAKKIVIAHEHQTKTTGKVIIPGNQIASSVSDWLGATSKSYVRINTTCTLVPCASAKDEFVELDWNNLEPVDTPFVRVVGSASAAEAAQVVTAIAKYREKSTSLVITNAVKIAALEGVDSEATLEGVQSYSVWDALGKVLTKDDMDILKGLQC